MNKNFLGHVVAVNRLANEIIQSEQNSDKLIDVTVETANNALSILAEFVNSQKQPKIERIGEKISLLNDVIATSNSIRATLFQDIVDDLNRLS
jgi:pyrimidine operon attenuation protein/uracil phosphoribosyltransferase